MWLDSWRPELLAGRAVGVPVSTLVRGSILIGVAAYCSTTVLACGGVPLRWLGITVRPQQDLPAGAGRRFGQHAMVTRVNVNGARSW